MKRTLAARRCIPLFGVQETCCAVSLALCIAFCVGCGRGGRPNTAYLEGMITIAGQPLPDDAQASITFSPMSGGRSAGGAVTNGKYICQDAPKGKVKVFPSVTRPTGRMITESDNRPYREVASIIAAKYASGIEIEVDGDDTNRNFDLEAISQ